MNIFKAKIVPEKFLYKVKFLKYYLNLILFHHLPVNLLQ